MENKLKIRHLNISMIKKDFIKNDSKKNNNEYEYDYEDYVLEWINESRFVKDNNGSLFKKVPHTNQSHGESDIENEVKNFELKMMVDSKTVERMAYYSYGIHKVSTGGICYTASKYNLRENTDIIKEYQLYWLIKIFRSKTCCDFVKLDKANKNEIKDMYDNIIKSFIPKIKKNKDIIYYFPIDIYYQEKETTKEIALEIVNAINNDLNGFMEFRTSKTNKDTYVCFVSKKYVIFAVYSQKLRLEYYDMVETNKSKLFEEIKDISTIW